MVGFEHRKGREEKGAGRHLIDSLVFDLYFMFPNSVGKPR